MQDAETKYKNYLKNHNTFIEYYKKEMKQIMNELQK